VRFLLSLSAIMCLVFFSLAAYLSLNRPDPKSVWVLEDTRAGTAASASPPSVTRIIAVLAVLVSVCGIPSGVWAVNQLRRMIAHPHFSEGRWMHVTERLSKRTWPLGLLAIASVVIGCALPLGTRTVDVTHKGPFENNLNMSMTNRTAGMIMRPCRTLKKSEGSDASISR
jgi:hypothetical protein